MFQRSVYKFVIILFALSVPFWILAALEPDFSKYLPLHLPISALMFVCPLIVSLIITYQEAGMKGVKKLFKRVFDMHRVKRAWWYTPLILFMPIILIISYAIMVLLGRSLPPFEISIVNIFLLFTIYFIAAACEELGWMGFVAERTTGKRTLLATSLTIGLIWAVWHIIPFFQTGHGVIWVLWQCVATVLYRVIIFWFYSNMGKSVFVAIIFHDMVNLSETLFPNNGSHFDPFIASMLLFIAVLVIIIANRGNIMPQQASPVDKSMSSP
jgi:membrane protease YdiL (CAAX protease family)